MALLAEPDEPKEAIGPFWLGHALLKEDLITERQFTSAKQVWRRRPNESFGSVLEELGLLSAHALTRLVAQKHALPMANLQGQAIDRAAARLIPAEAARKKCVLPYRQDEQRLHVAVEDPSAYGLRQAKADFPWHEVQLEVAHRREILGRLDEVWRTAGPANAEAMFRALLVEAITDRATDLHLEPRGHVLDVRERIDGRLLHRHFIEKDAWEPLIQAAKIAGRMDIAERRLPQDGHGELEIGARDYHLRYSCIPSAHGESVVVRIIDDQTGVRTLPELGLLPADQARVQEMLSLPHGLVYVTGPTGSGKTTLLYSMLQSLPPQRMNEIKIVTLEEPVEVRHPRYFMQVSVDERVGRTFSEVLRHVLRHDPDVVLVGETRDRATAETTLRAALTGRLCFSTLHTNDALGAITRLTDIGLDPMMLASALRGVIAQRLVRKPCPECKRIHPQHDLLKSRFASLAADEGIELGPHSFPAVETGRDCPICRGRGFWGRTAIAEVCPLSGMERQIARRLPVSILRDQLRERGVRTLFEDGVRKAALGLTTIEEVFGAVEAPEGGGYEARQTQLLLCPSSYEYSSPFTLPEPLFATEQPIEGLHAR